MGIIQRQSIKQSLVNYTGVGIAALSMVFIYPQDIETYGLARFLIDTAFLFSPFIVLGFGGVSIRFFPQFKDESKAHNGLLFFLILAVSIGSLIFIILAFLFEDQFLTFFSDKPDVYKSYFVYLIPLAILVSFLQLFYLYSSNFKRIAIPALFLNIIKLSLPILILLFVWKIIPQQMIVYGIVLTYAVAVLASMVYLKILGQWKIKPDFSFLNRKRLKEIRSFAMFGFFNNMGGMLAFRIDTFMIAALIDYQNTGIFAISAFIANTIAIPTNAINQIANPIVAEAIKNEDMNSVKDLYKSSSLNLLVIGLLLFICIIASVEDLFSIMPNSDSLKGGMVIVLFIGAAKLIDMGTSINNQIINYSKYYRFSFVSIIIMAVFNILANLVLIPKLGIIGAALATLLSLVLYNLIKLLFIQWRFKMHPFSIKSVWIILIASGAYFVGVLIPSTGIAVLDIIIKSIIIISLYTSATLYFNISSEIRSLLENALDKIKQVF